MGKDQRRIDLPAVRRRPLRRGEARGFVGPGTGRGVVGHPQLGGRQAQIAGKARKRGIEAGIADPRLIAQHFVGQAIAADLGKLHGQAHVVDRAQLLPVVVAEIGRGGELAFAHPQRFGGHHAIERVPAAGGGAQRRGHLFGLAAAQPRAAGPVVRGRGELLVLGLPGGFFEAIGGGKAIVHAPACKAGGPQRLGDPRAGAFNRAQRNGAGVGILIFDVERPADLLAPFGARVGR